MDLTRRKLFLAAAVAALPRLNNAADLSRMTVRSSSPEDLEMPLEGFKEWITPVERFFVRCHALTPPRANLAEWKLKLDGVVNQPLTLTMDDLRELPRVEFASVLECAGNGRVFYEPHVTGTQWAFGGVGNAKWAGVRFRDVLAKAGLKDSAQHILLDGADVPMGKMPDFQRTLTVKKALDPDTLLAFEMNGQPLPVEHGFPLRLVVPGWAGDSWVKWLQHIEVLDHEFDGFWMKTAYRHPSHSVAPGAVVDPSEMIPVTDLNVKSVIATPDVGGWTKPGRVRISGTAWSNSSPVTRVEVSVDGGKTWKPARLGKDQSRYAWRLWELDWKATEGKYTLLARATNAAGQTQPLKEEWNPSGYLWNVAQPLEIKVTSQRPVTGELAQRQAHPPGYQAACLTCHDEGMIVQQHITRAQWDKELNKMSGWGAPMKPEDREGILKYLSDQFKP